MKKNKKDKKFIYKSILVLVFLVLVVAVFILPHVDSMFAEHFGASVVTSIILLLPVILIVMLVAFFANNI